MMSHLKSRRPWWLALLVALLSSSGCGGCGCAGREHPAFIAAAQGDVESVAAALDEDPTLLHETYRTGWTMKGRGPNPPSNTGKTLAHLAAENGQLEVLKLLAERGADLEAKNNAFSGHHRPIHYAAEKKHRAVVAFLLEKGVDVNAQTEYHDAALHIAVRHLDVEMVEMLLAKKADPNVITKRHHATHQTDRTPLHELALVGNLNVMHKEKNAKDRAAILDMLLKAGAEVNRKDSAGKTPLHRATHSSLSPEELIELLVKNGADVNARDNDQATPLHLGIAGKRVVEVLLANKADVNARNKDQATPLHLGVAYKEVVVVLLAHKADVNARNGQGLTPVELLPERYFYSLKDRDAVAELLIARGAARELWDKARREHEKKNAPLPQEKK